MFFCKFCDQFGVSISSVDNTIKDIYFFNIV